MKIYVMYHDEESKNKAKHLCNFWSDEVLHQYNVIKNNENFDKNKDKNPIPESVTFQPILVPKSPFLESGTYLTLLECIQDWENEDYVGLVTYSIIEKLSQFLKKEMRLQWYHILIECYKKNLDAVGLFGLIFSRSNKKISLLEGSVFQHGFNFYNAWRGILQSLGYDQEKIDEYDELGFFCNWWFAKPLLFREYVIFILKAIRHVNEDPYLSEIFSRDAHYGTGTITEAKRLELFKKPYYTIHPFVFERLLSFFLRQKEIYTGCVTRMYMKIS